MQPAGALRSSALALALVLLVAPAARQQALQCSQPQPRALPASDLAGATPGQLLHPPYAVLHRCDGGAGSCVSGMSCEPTAQEEVQLVFLATSVVEPSATEDTYHVVTATNHTSCGCTYMQH